MNKEYLKMSIEQAVEDFEFFVEYKNSLTHEELVISTIDFEELGIY